MIDVTRRQNDVCTYSYGGLEYKIAKIKGGKIRKFEFIVEGSVLARFDTEDKARMYADAFEQGLKYGEKL